MVDQLGPGMSGRTAPFAAAVAAAVLLTAWTSAQAAPTSQPGAGAATQPDARARLTLDQVMAPVTLPEPKATTQPELPAQARDLMAEADKLIAQKRTIQAVVQLAPVSR